MPRPIWSGVVSFGMVAIPVKLFSATTSNDVSFNQLHKDCNSRVKYQKWCPVHEKEVSGDEIVKGYEYAKGRYVILDDEDFEKLPVASKHTINIERFVELKEIDPVYFDKSYFLEPDDAGIKPYTLFMKALEEKNMVGIGEIALRQREHLCALRPVNGVLILETLFYAEEVKVDISKELPDVKLSEQEMTMANTLVDMLKGEFKPEEFQDDYRTVMMSMIEAKMQGQEVVEAVAAPTETKVIDLMEALKQSVEAARKAG